MRDSERLKRQLVKRQLVKRQYLDAFTVVRRSIPGESVWIEFLSGVYGCRSLETMKQACNPRVVTHELLTTSIQGNSSILLTERDSIINLQSLATNRYRLAIFILGVLALFI